MPRQLPDPTGRPSPRAAAVMRHIAALAASEPADSEGHLTRLRDLQHIYTTAVDAWERTLVRTALLPPDGRPSHQDIADVSNLHVQSLYQRVRSGRGKLHPEEREHAEEVARERAAVRTPKALRNSGPAAPRTVRDQFVAAVAASADGTAWAVRSKPSGDQVTSPAAARVGWVLVTYPGGRGSPVRGDRVYVPVTLDSAVNDALLSASDTQDAPPDVAAVLTADDDPATARRLGYASAAAG